MITLFPYLKQDQIKSSHIFELTGNVWLIYCCVNCTLYSLPQKRFVDQYVAINQKIKVLHVKDHDLLFIWLTVVYTINILIWHNIW